MKFPVRLKQQWTAEQWHPEKDIPGVYRRTEDMPSDCGYHIAVCISNNPNSYGAIRVSEETYELVRTGDWILTDEAGKQKVVSMKDFDQLYEYAAGR